MPTDYTTTNITPAAPSGESLTEPQWFLKPSLDFSPLMATGYPRTPHETGSGGPRPQLGLVFPR